MLVESSSLWQRHTGSEVKCFPCLTFPVSTPLCAPLELIKQHFLLMSDTSGKQVVAHQTWLQNWKGMRSAFNKYQYKDQGKKKQKTSQPSNATNPHINSCYKRDHTGNSFVFCKISTSLQLAKFYLCTDCMMLFLTLCWHTRTFSLRSCLLVFPCTVAMSLVLLPQHPRKTSPRWQKLLSYLDLEKLHHIIHAAKQTLSSSNPWQHSLIPLHVIRRLECY